ncbi:MAG: formate/nitrite transporter family protein [Clostridia bacterium]
MVKRYTPAFFKAILAGLMIALGATAYLTVENHYVGAALFTIGLFTIYTLDLYLYTGKVGYLLEDKDILKILVIWVGNLVGILASAFMLLSTRIISTTTLIEHAESYAEVKLSDNYFSIFILGIFCGIMMFIAAQSFKLTQNTSNSFGGYIGLFLCVMIFLLLGFEHSIANMFYFTIAGVWSFKAVIALIIVSLGNAVGGLLINILSIPINKYSTH